jgi:hypothetical protein
LIIEENKNLNENLKEKENYINNTLLQLRIAE